MLQVRTAQASDLNAILHMFRDELKREPRVARTAARIKDLPSAVAEDNGSLVGFCYTADFAPDVLELANIVVSSDWRNSGVGGRLLAHVEAQASSTFTAIILVNSDLYPDGKSEKRPATNFYLSHDYRMIAATQGTRIFFKDLN